jgi:hypothetical protein
MFAVVKLEIAHITPMVMFISAVVEVDVTLRNLTPESLAARDLFTLFQVFSDII